MSTGFKYKGSDLDDMLEPYSGLSPNPDFTDYTVNGSSLAGRYSGSDKNWEKKMTGGGYFYRGTQINACLRGYYPTIGTIFQTVTGGAGEGTRNIYLSRSDAYLTLSGDVSRSLSVRSFRNGRIPMAIGLLFCAGGGSTGRTSYTAYHDWDILHWFPYTGYYWSGGGGGGMALCVLSFDGLTETPRLLLGAGATNGEGGRSSLYIGNTEVIRAMGGWQGYGSTGAYGGAGGSAGRVINSHPNVFFLQGIAGAAGTGNSNTNQNLPGCSFNATIASTDSAWTFGTPATHLAGGSGSEEYRINRGLGGGSLNGAYTYEHNSGVNGAGGGSDHGEDDSGTYRYGGAGMVYMFY